MPTTALLIEIVIVGFGFFLSMIPIATVFIGSRPEDILAFYIDIPLIFQLSASYVAGVFWNRVCDQIFHLFDEKVIASKFPSREDFQQARIEIVIHSESVRDYVGNFRSLIRISRATSVLLLVYSVSTPIYLIVNKHCVFPKSNHFIITLIPICLLTLSSYAWYRLEDGYIAAVKVASEVIKAKTEERKSEKRGRGFFRQ